MTDELISDAALAAIRANIERQFESLGVEATVTVDRNGPVTWQTVLDQLDEIEQRKPVLVCRPEDEQQLKDLAAEAGLPITVIPSPELPPGGAFVQIKVF